MDDRGHGTATPVAGEGMPSAPFTSFAAGYIKRALDDLPRQGSRPPWRMPPTYTAERKLLRRQPAGGPDLRFGPV
jgi:hypothetical protein